MRLRELNVGCFGGGTGLPSLLGGLKNNPWLHANAVVTMFDSGGSSGQLRDELGERTFQYVAGRQHAERVAQLSGAATAVEHRHHGVRMQPGIVLQSAEQAGQSGAAAEA